MKEITDRILAPVIGFVTSFLSWEAFSSFIISLAVAFLGGFLAHFGRHLARRYTEKRKEKNNAV